MSEEFGPTLTASEKMAEKARVRKAAVAMKLLKREWQIEGHTFTITKDPAHNAEEEYVEIWIEATNPQGRRIDLDMPIRIVSPPMDDKNPKSSAEAILMDIFIYMAPRTANSITGEISDSLSPPEPLMTSLPAEEEVEL